jgi:protein arginine kinase activator
MKCQKCAKPAVVHLTDVVTEPTGIKQAVEIHLCLGHAVEAGLVAPGSELLPQVLTASPVISQKKNPPVLKEEGPTSIMPLEPAAGGSGGGLVVSRPDKASEAEGTGCPICGLTWSQFKHSGLMGCPHDYEQLEGKIEPLLKRAQEGAVQHVGKVPGKHRTEETERQVVSLRLRKELQKAIDAENYEQAARLRDELRELDRN